MSCDDFKLVHSRRKTHRNPPTSWRIQEQGETDVIVNIQVEIQKIDKARNELDESEFIKGVRSIFEEALAVCGGESISEIVCYGLGNFSQSKISRYQLALLLLLRDKFQATVYAHDPIFYSCEVNILRELGICIIDENEEGKRLLNDQVTTLLYVPHCPKQLANNFLWKNWGLGLKDCILFGNSFSCILDRLILSEINIPSFMLKIQPYTLEFPLVNDKKFLDIFNDTSVHVFPENKLSALEPSFWTENCGEPVYPVCDLELIVKKQ